MEHSKSRATKRVHSNAQPSMVSMVPNPTNHKKTQSQKFFHLFWRAIGHEIAWLNLPLVLTMALQEVESTESILDAGLV
jgi:hypothetical protein